MHLGFVPKDSQAFSHGLEQYPRTLSESTLQHLKP